MFISCESDNKSNIANEKLQKETKVYKIMDYSHIEEDGNTVKSKILVENDNDTNARLFGLVLKITPSNKLLETRKVLNDTFVDFIHIYDTITDKIKMSYSYSLESGEYIPRENIWIRNNEIVYDSSMFFFIIPMDDTIKISKKEKNLKLKIDDYSRLDWFEIKWKAYLYDGFDKYLIYKGALEKDVSNDISIPTRKINKSGYIKLILRVCYNKSDSNYNFIDINRARYIELIDEN